MGAQYRILPQRWNSMKPLSKSVLKPGSHTGEENPWVLKTEYCPRDGTAFSPYPKKTRKIIVHKPCSHIWKEVSPWMLNTEYCPRDGTTLSVYPNLILQRVALHKPSSHIEKESDHGCSLQTIALEMERH